METTHHFVATVYVVSDGATLLHHHDRLDMWLPPGGHVEREELPRETARREVREETGLDVTLRARETSVESATATELPGPEHLLLEDIHHYDDGSVGHRHVDFIYFGRTEGRGISPADGERAAEHWEWLTPAQLRDRDLPTDVSEIGREAIAAFE